MPIYNVEKYLERCLYSIVNQTYRELDIVLIDDGSTDGSHAIAETFAQQDKRVRLFSQTNHGQASARNQGVKRAKGEYITFVDSDDYINEDYIQTMMDAIGELDVVQIGYQRVRPEGEILSRHIPKHFYQFTSACMRLYKRKLIIEHELHFPEGMYYEDVVFSLRVWQQEPRYRMIHYTGYNYIVNPTSTTSKRHKQDEERVLWILRDAIWHGRRKWVAIYTLLRLRIHFILNN